MEAYAWVTALSAGNHTLGLRVYQLQTALTSCSTEMKLRFAWLPWMCAGALLAAERPQIPGVSNFHQVDERVYRGAQPTGRGFESLARLGVKTVIDLRPDGEHSLAEEKRLVESQGMRYISLPLRKMSAPTGGQIAALLAVLMNGSAAPVFIHCQRGADRTGAIVACYRIAHDHWDNSRALHEARDYGMRWYQLALKSYVLGYQPPPTSIASAPAITTDSPR